MAKPKKQLEDAWSRDVPAAQILTEVLADYTKKADPKPKVQELLDTITLLSVAMQNRGIEGYAKFLKGYAKELRSELGGWFLGLGKAKQISSEKMAAIARVLKEEWGKTTASNPLATSQATANIPNKLPKTADTAPADQVVSKPQKPVKKEKPATSPAPAKASVAKTKPKAKTEMPLAELAQMKKDYEARFLPEMPAQKMAHRKKTAVTPVSEPKPIAGQAAKSEPEHISVSSQAAKNDKSIRFFHKSQPSGPLSCSALIKAKKEYDVLFSQVQKAQGSDAHIVALDCLADLADVLHENNVQDRSDPAIGDLQLRVLYCSRACEEFYKKDKQVMDKSRVAFADLAEPMLNVKEVNKIFEDVGKMLDKLLKKAKANEAMLARQTSAAAPPSPKRSMR